MPARTGLVAALQAVLALPGVGVRDWPERAARALVGSLTYKAARVEIGTTSSGRFVPELGASAVSSNWPSDRGVLAAVEVAGVEAPRPIPAVGIELLEPGASHPLRGLGPFNSVARSTVSLGTETLMEAHVGYAGEPNADQMLRVSVLLECLASRARALAGEGGEPIDWLSARETEVFDLLVKGMSLPEISRTLFRSQHTIHDHVKAIYRKNRAASRAGLMARALANPLGT